MFEGKDILGVASEHLNQTYLAGATAPLGDPDWIGPWDAAHFVSWCAYNAYGSVFGCEPKDPSIALASPKLWFEDGLMEDAIVPVADALATPGAILLRLPNGHAPGHVAISDGRRGVYEARGPKYGTAFNVGADIRRWDHGLLLPGVLYETDGEIPDYDPPETYRVARGTPYLRGDDIKLIQFRLLYFGFGSAHVDGVYGRGTQAAVRSFQLWAGLNVDGEVGAETAETLGLPLYAEQLADMPTLYTSIGGAEGLPDEVGDFLIFHETGGRVYYERNVLNPIWPAHSSGVTIGIGYDIGHQREDAFRDDWSDHLSARDIDRLARYIGETGDGSSSAADRRRFDEYLEEVSDIEVPWEAAIDVFARRSIPAYCADTRDIYPEFDDLPPRCRGALLSLTYNRGFSLNPDRPRRREMIAIRDHLAANRWIDVPAEIESMKRLWPTSTGLRRRRDEEAEFFDWGLAGHI